MSPLGFLCRRERAPVDVINPWMLLGLMGIAIPILVHLLSRRKQDVVDWGAMQFLEPSPRERRTLWIENFWLLLLRVGLIALLAIALARPWFQSTWLSHLTTTRPQDVALILDGSYSLEQSATAGLAGDRVRQLAREVLDELDPSDALQIYDARDSVRPLLPGYTRQRRPARDALIDLPQPTGSSHIPAALQVALRDLLQTSNLDRDVVIVTDGQRLPWHVDQRDAWNEVDQLLQQARITPRIWVLTADSALEQPPNLAIGPVELSQDLAMPGATIQIRAPVRLFGSAAPQSCTVRLDINGLRSPAHTATLRVPAVGAAIAEFEVQFDRPGCHALNLVLDADDALPADNTAQAVVEIGTGRAALLVSDFPEADKSVANPAYFLRAALDAGLQGAILPRSVSTADWDLTQLTEYAVVVLVDLATLSDEQQAAVRSYVEGGGSLLVVWGPLTTASALTEPSDWFRWLGNVPISVQGDPAAPDAATTIMADSLELPWQQRFRQRRTSGLGDVRFARWWKTDALKDAEHAPLQVVARFASGDPGLLWGRRGDGSLAVWTSSVDAAWNAFPARPDFVAWWHEVLFALMEPQQRRNVPVGSPLIALGPLDSASWSGVFVDAFGRKHPGEALFLGKRAALRLPVAHWPGFYVFHPGELPAAASPDLVRKLLASGADQVYAAQLDPVESDLTPLSADDRSQCSADRPLRFLASPAELRGAWMGDAGRFELAGWLLYLLLGFLVWEVWLTSRMVQRGSGQTPEPEASDS